MSNCSVPASRSPNAGRPENLLDRFRGRIMFPTSDARGRVIGFGARTMVRRDRGQVREHAPRATSTTSARCYTGSSGPTVAAKVGRMVLAEGYTDVIALQQAGVPTRRDHGDVADRGAGQRAGPLRPSSRALPRRRQRRPGSDCQGRETLCRLWP